MPLRFARLFFAIAFVAFFGVCPLNAQITDVNNSTSTPTPGAGHNYLGTLNETVDPANGSLSLRLGVSVPPGRKMQVPFSFAYDSNGVHFPSPTSSGNVTGVNWTSNLNSLMAQGGWAYAVPQLGWSGWKKQHNWQGTNYDCWFATNFLLQDLSGGRHSLGIGWNSNRFGCSNSGSTGSLAAQYLNGGDDQYRASLSTPGISAAFQGAVSADGTLYSFSAGSCTSHCSALVNSIEDRNGNQVLFTSSGAGVFSVTDELGRALLSSSGFGATGNTIAVSGISNPYSVTWGSATSNFSVSETYPPNAPANCPIPSSVSGTQSVMTAITLPNGQNYQFSYDPTYGELSKITYPAGGYVSYSWGLNVQSAVYEGNGDGITCASFKAIYDKPAILHRYVSFNGSAIALQQDFAYSTTWDPSNWDAWTSKQTTVTTRDLVRGTSFQTIYNYVPYLAPMQPYSLSALDSRIALESTIIYKNTSGTTLKTVTKGWFDQYELACQLETLDSGQISGVFYSYGPGGQVTDKKEYDYGIITSTSACPGIWTGSTIPPAATPTRETVYNYQSFPNTPIFTSGASIFDRPSSVLTYGNGVRAAETDFSYDQVAVSAVSPAPAGHDETNYSAGSAAPRGNATTIVRQCFQGAAACTNATSTFTFDETGQILSKKDACGNATCSDMTTGSHITAFSYTDNFDSPPAYTTNAYVTQITDPLGHIAKFKYAYSDGQPISSIDQNNLTTSYVYADSLRRLTETDLPDGGKTTVAYNDTVFSPSVTTTRKINVTQSFVSIAVMDGLGHTVKTKLCEDGSPCAQPIQTDATFDGLGRAWKVSNPYRTTSDSTYGITTTTYDVLGRTTLVVPPDGTSNSNNVTTQYSGNCTVVTDQTLRARKSCSDGLGRLVEVDEPGYGTSPATSGTGSVTISGSERSVTFDPCAPAHSCPQTIYDGGTITVTVNGVQAGSTGYGQSTPSSLATALASNINGNSSSPVTAAASGPTVNLTAKTAGSNTNYSLSATSATQNTTYFSGTSFPVSTSGSALTGGSDSFTGLSLNTPAVTRYTYDALGNLLCSVQKSTDTTPFSTCAAASATWRPRSFTYDSLSRMLTSTNPEVGTLTYTYDANSNVSTKKDARNITTTYGYDVLNRNLSASYSNGDPGVTVVYDQANCLGLSACQNIGQRTSMTDAAGSEAWSYQVDSTNLRSVHVNQRTNTGIPTKTSTYYFNLAGGLTSIVYPTSRTVNFTYDNAGRPATSTDSANGITYASGTCGSAGTAVCYAPQGALATAKIGVSSVFPGGLVLTNTYNNRLQPNELKASSTGGNAFDISYNFVDAASQGNAGHVYGITNNIDGTRSQVFTYDPLNRIASAKTTSTHATSAAHCWGEVYTTDAWANLQTIAATTDPAYTGCTQESGFTKTPDNFNHVSGFGYDLSGNTTSDGTIGYSWDGESQLKSATNGGVATNYTYDGQGRRVSKSNGKFYWYGSGGEILAETTATGATTNEYIFFGGKRIALLPAGSTAQFYAEDFLGSSRVVTTNTGVVCYDADFYPYGGERTPYTNTCTQNAYKFEGKERDAETGNDDFGSRYYSNRFGRWLSADWSNVPVPIPYANLRNPQSLNLYSMVGDDPESFADLDGHCCLDCPPSERASCLGHAPENIRETELGKLADDQLAEQAAQNQQNQSANVVYVSSDVSGATAAEAAQNVSIPCNGGTSMGCTQMAYHYVDSPSGPVSGGSPPYTATLTANVTVTVSITVTLPNWTGYKNASPAEQKAWNATLADVKRHEEGHVSIDKAGAVELKAALLQKAIATSSGRSQDAAIGAARAKLKATLDGRAKEVMARIGQRSNAYDDAEAQRVQ